MFELKKIETLSKSAQIEEMIKEKILSGELKPDDQLPSEVSIAAELGTHRLTVNKAVSSLVRDGLLYRKHGRGTFVKDQSAI
ncbi:MAG: GntR family transcriptional regulator, partial [Victivallales bacterium]